MKHKLILLMLLCMFAHFFLSASLWAYEVSAAGACSVPNSHPDALRFYNRVKGFSGWTGNFYKEDNNSREIQYKRHSLGGQNNYWVDSSDIHYHISHGGSRWDSYWGKYLTAVLFEDGTRLDAGEARSCWGDNDLEWIAFRNCKMLDNNSKGYWATAMNRLHLILGFKTNSSKHDNFGKIWAGKMKKTKFLWWTFPGQTITQAWFNTTDATQPSGTTARVLAEVHDNYNDHLWGQGYTSSDPPNDNIYWWWDHTAGSPPYLRVSGLQQMYVYRVIPRLVDEQYVQEIGAAFGMQGEVVDLCDRLVMAQQDESGNPQILEISKATGHYHFHDDGKLFVADTSVGQYPPSQAIEVAQTFLVRNKLLPADARAYSVEWDTITEEDRDTGRAMQVLYQNTNVVWARQIPAEPDQTLVSVAGSGARLRVYVAEDGAVMGGQGNWRNVEAASSVPVNDPQKTWSYFEAFGQQVAVEPPLVLYDDAVPDMDNPIQLYYEFSSETSQTDLIPCWLFEVDYYLKGEFVLTAETFIPVTELFFPPIVEITLPTDGTVFNAGDTVDFQCQVVAGFGTLPYNFQWESSVDGILATQQNFKTDALTVNCPDTSMDCSPLPHTITVAVTDAKGLSSSDSIQVTINGPCDECEDPADINGDKKVDLVDFSYLASRYLMESGQPE